MFNINEDKFVAKLTRNSDRTKVEKEVEADSHIEARELFKSMKSFWKKYFFSWEKFQNAVCQTLTILEPNFDKF